MLALNPQLLCFYISASITRTSCSVCFSSGCSRLPWVSVLALGGCRWGRGGHILGWGGKRPGFVTQHPARQWQLLRHSYHHSAFHLFPALCLDHWSPLHGICWSLRLDCSGFQRVKNLPCNSPLLLVLQGASGCILQCLCFFFLSTSLSYVSLPPLDSLMHMSFRHAGLHTVLFVVM